MGQLEKYGLYVLCLVIFLILGVAIWGEPAMSADNQARHDSSTSERPAPREAAVIDLGALMSQTARPDVGADGGRTAAGNTGSGAGGPATDKGGDKGADKNADDKGADKKATDKKATDKKATDGKTAGREPEPKAAGTEPASTGARPLHKVASGDTLEAIAKQLGDVRLVPLLKSLNPKLQPERMQVGQEIALPTAAELAKATGAAAKDGKAATEPPDAAHAPAKKPVEPAAGGRTHRIERGDTLEGLAKRYFNGDTRRVADIKALNPTLDPAALRIGRIIKLPAK